MSGRSSSVSVNKTVRHQELGNTTVKFVLVLVILFVVGYGTYNYLITWYEVTQFRDSVKERIDRANMSVKSIDTDIEKIKEYIRNKAAENRIPADAVIKVEKSEKGTTARTTFTREVAVLPLDLYRYKYQVDYIAGPPQGFLTK